MQTVTLSNPSALPCPALSAYCVTAITLKHRAWVSPKVSCDKVPCFSLQSYINAAGLNFALEANDHGLFEFRVGKVAGRESSPAAPINVTNVLPGLLDQLISGH